MVTLMSRRIGRAPLHGFTCGGCATGWWTSKTIPTTHLLDVVDQTPADVRTANELADFWIDRVLGRAMPAAERSELVEFMAQGHNPTYDLPIDSDCDTQERLRSMVSLIFMSPSFLWR